MDIDCDPGGGRVHMTLPAVNLERDALAKPDSLAPGIAVLDISLAAGQTSVPVVAALRPRGIPFTFVTGYGDTTKWGQDFDTSPVLKKPLRENKFRTALAEVWS